MLHRSSSLVVQEHTAFIAGTSEADGEVEVFTIPGQTGQWPLSEEANKWINWLSDERLKKQRTSDT